MTPFVFQLHCLGRRTRRRPAAALILLVLSTACALSGNDPAHPPAMLDSLPKLFHEDFERGADRWRPTDPTAWRVLELPDGNHVYEQFQQSHYVPPVRSPVNISLLSGLRVSDCIVQARLRQGGGDPKRRDMVIVFGYQNPSHFYYAHMAPSADDVHNSIFKVDGADRVSIAARRTAGVPWGDAPHTVRLVREVTTGYIAVYFDNMKTPVMTAYDSAFLSGQIGFGTFDDTGRVDDVTVWGVSP